MEDLLFLHYQDLMEDKEPKYPPKQSFFAVRKLIETSKNEVKIENT